MIRPAAGVGDERSEPLGVELRDERRGQLVGDEHERPFDVAHARHRVPFRPQIHPQAADDVGDVAFSFAQVGVVQLIEQRRQLFERALERGRGVQPVGADDLDGAIHEHRVVEHEPLGLEDVGVIGAGGVGDPLLDLRDLDARVIARGVQARNFPFDASLRDAKAQFAGAPRDDDRPADADPR